MAITYSDYTGDGVETDFAFSFPYLEDTHVVVEVDGIDKTTTAGDFTLPTTSLVRMTVAPALAAAVRVKRVSDFATDLVDFTNGSVLTEGDLDRAYQHNRYLNEEAAEGNNASMQQVGGGTDFNADNKKIVNLADPTLTTDATNKNYVDTQVALSGTNLSGFESSTHTGDNTAVDFTLSFTPQVSTPEAFLVTIDGVVQKPTTAYTIDPDTPKITFTSAPPTSAVINVVAIATSSTSADSTTVKATGSTTARSLAARAADVANVKDFGAVGDGTTDDTASIQAAFNSSAGSVYIPSGTYKLTTTLTLYSDKRVFGDGTNSVLNSDGITSTQYVFNVGRAPGTSSKTLVETNASAIAAGDFQYTFSTTAHGLAVADIVAVHNDTVKSYNNINDYYKKGEFLVVKKVDGATVTFFSGFYDDYTVSSAEFYKLSMKKVALENFVISGTPASYSEYCLNMVECRDSLISNVYHYDGGSYHGISLSRCYNVTIENCTSRITEYGSLSPTNAYPFIIGNSQDIKVNACTGESPWHAIAVGGGSTVPNIVNRGVRVSGSAFTSTEGAFAADFHGNVEHSGYYNCTLKGAGCTLGSNYNSFIGNSVIGIREDMTKSSSGVLAFYGSETIGWDFNVQDNFVELNGWYPYNNFGNFLNLNVDGQNLADGSLNVSGNNVVLLGTTRDASAPNNYIMRIRAQYADQDATNTHINISNNSIVSKLDTNAFNTISITGGGTTNDDQLGSVTIANNNLKKCGISCDYTGVTNISDNVIDDAYYGIKSNFTKDLKISGNQINDSIAQGLYVSTVYAGSAVINGNQITGSNQGNVGSGTTNNNVYLSFGTNSIQGVVISDNIFRDTEGRSYILVIGPHDTVSILETNNLYLGSPSVVKCRNTNTGSPGFVSNRSNLHERTHTQIGTSSTDVCKITFDNPNWGACYFECDSANDLGGDKTGKSKASIKGHAATTPVVENFTYTQGTDPEGTDIIFTATAPVPGVSASVTISTVAPASSVIRNDFKIIAAARESDIDNLHIDWLI